MHMAELNGRVIRVNLANQIRVRPSSSRAGMSVPFVFGRRARAVAASARERLGRPFIPPRACTSWGYVAPPPTPNNQR